MALKMDPNCPFGSDSYPEPGPKPVVAGQKAVCSTSHASVTQTALKVLSAGGNAFDAAIAASLVQAVVEPHMTNHAGTVTMLCWSAVTGEMLQLTGTGTFPADLAPFRPLPPSIGGYCAPGEPAVSACIPGFVPGLGAIHDRLGSLPWAVLCEDAVRWAEDGHRVSSFEYGLLYWNLPFSTYFSEGQRHFMPEDVLSPVGSSFKRPELAHTMERLAAEGPSYFTEGAWAEAFVATANRLGWPLRLAHMTETPPRWQTPLQYQHRDFDIFQLAPPERQGVFCALVLGILDEIGITEFGHYTTSPESLYFLAHVLRWAEFQTGYLNDPHIFNVPTDVWLSKDFHRHIAKMFVGGQPKKDLSTHVRLMAGKAASHASGLASGLRTGAGSCELSIVDQYGNWVQSLNTLQSGGIPGMVVGGVPMVGSHAHLSDMGHWVAGWLVPKSRLRCVMGNTIVCRDGRPVLSLGTPGLPHFTVAQVLSNILDFDMAPYEAIDVPRLAPLSNNFGLSMEDRIPDPVKSGLTKHGIRFQPLPAYDYHMGSFQMSWRDKQSGLLSTCADPRRCGVASGLVAA